MHVFYSLTKNVRKKVKTPISSSNNSSAAYLHKSTPAAEDDTNEHSILPVPLVNHSLGREPPYDPRFGVADGGAVQLKAIPKLEVSPPL